MKGIFIGILCLLGLQAAAQKSYSDSLRQHRRQYTADLYPIIKNDTAWLSFFPANAQMIVTATVERLPDEQTFKMTTSSGKTKEAQKYALLRFRIGGKPYQLYVYQLLQLKAKAETANELFLPFIDRTCGAESYGGGRYIDLQLTDIRDGKVRIDFNKAYNPYCAFTTGYNCPIPPRENGLPIAIKAGEKYRKEHFKH